MAAAAEVHQGPRTLRGGEKTGEQEIRRPDLELKDLLKALNPGIQKLPLFSFVTQTQTSNPPLPQMILFKTISVSVNFPATTHPLVVNQSLISLREQLEQQLLNHINTNPPTELEQIKSGGHVCFLGQAGSGKTTLLRVIARHSITGRYGYIKIKYVHMIHPGPFESESECFAWQAIFSCNIGKPEDRFSDAESKTLFDHAEQYPKKFLLLFDSLDTLPKNLNEVKDPGNAYRPDQKYPSSVHLSMLLRGRLLKGCRIVTSSRPHAVTINGDLAASRYISLSGFSKDDALKVLKLYSADANEIFKIVKSTPHLFSLFKEPVFLVYLVEIWPALRKDHEKMRATDILINLVGRFRDSCHAKGNYQKLKEMQKLAHEILWRRKLEFDEASLKNYDLKIEDLTDLCTNASDKSGNKQINLRLTTGKSLFMFSHQSVQEMFAAVDLAESKMCRFENDIKIIHEPFFLKTRDFLYGLLFGRFGHDESEFPDMAEKREELKKSIESRFQVARSPQEQLSIFETLAEAITGAGQFNLETANGVNFSGIPMNDWSLYCTGIATSQFTVLQVLHLEGCGIQHSHLRALKTGICQYQSEKLKIFSFSLRNNQGIGKPKDAVAIACDIVKKCKVRDFDMSFCGLNSGNMSQMLDGLRDINIDALNLEFNTIGKKGVEIAGTLVKQCSIKAINISECATTSEEAEAFGKSAKGSEIERLIIEHRKENIVSGYGNVIRDCDVGSLVILLTTFTPEDAITIKKDSCHKKITGIEFTALVINAPPRPPVIIAVTESNCQSIRTLLPIVKKQISIPVGMPSNLIENLQSSLDDLEYEGPVITFPTANKMLTLTSNKRQSQTGNNETEQKTTEVDYTDEKSGTTNEDEIAMEMEAEFMDVYNGSDTVAWLRKYVQYPKLVADVLAVHGLSIHRFELNLDDRNLVAKTLSHCSELKKFNFSHSEGLKPMLDALIQMLDQPEMSLPKAANVCFAGYRGIDKERSNQFVKFVELFQAEGLVLTSVNASHEGLQYLRDDLKRVEQGEHFKRLEIFHNPEIDDEGWKCLAGIAKDFEETPLEVSACYCDVEDGQLETFKNALGSVELGKIDISGNRKLTKEGFETLGEIVKGCNVPSVALQDCNLDREKVQSFNTGCGIDSSTQRITYFNVANNTKLGKDGIEEIKKTVHCLCVENLNIASCMLGNVTFENEFESLNISGNPSCESISELAKTVKQRLYLRNCMLNTTELTNLAGEMKKQSKLTEIDVSDCSRQIDPDFIDSLVGMFKDVTEYITVAVGITIPTAEEC